MSEGETVVARHPEPMQENELVGNVSPERKRKADDADVDSKLELKTPSAEKKQKTEDENNAQSSSTTPLVELKGRKLVLHQDAYKIAIPRRSTLNFETMLLDAEEAKKPITEIFEEHYALVAMLGHESSARTENLFIKQLKTALLGKSGVDGDLLSSDAISALLPKLFRLEDYGFIHSDFPSSSSTTKVPVTLQVKCWEAIDPETHFSAEQWAILGPRRDTRIRARQECLSILAEMDDIEKLELLRGEKGEKGEKVEKPKGEKVQPTVKPEGDVFTVENVEKVAESSTAASSIPRKAREGTANTMTSTRSGRSVSPVKKSKMTPEEEEAARLRKEEREAKKLAKIQKKAAEDEEQEKKAQALAKQAKAMSAFFKPKSSPKPIEKVVQASSEAGPSSPQKPSVSELSDYQRTFRPIPLRDNIIRAPINPWRESKRFDNLEDPQLTSWSSRDYIGDHLRRHRRDRNSRRRHVPLGLKSAPLHGSVGEVWAAHLEAEDPREILASLADRSRFPWKTLAFDNQVRPPYCGTYSKRSVAVGGRTPFAQDPALDYSYDSGDDWQDDEGGEDVDDFGEGKAATDDDEDAESDDEAGEFDDWLDDSEDVGFAPGDDDSDGIPDVSPAAQTKLPRQVVKQRIAPKKVTKLTPYWRGPMWEEEIGAGSEGMESMRLQLLNDTPDTIDPFKYTSSDAAQVFKTSYSSTVIGTNLAVKCLLSAEPITKPAPSASSTATAAQDGETGSAQTVDTKKAGPKIGFPESHLPELLQAIEGNTKIRTDLVSQLREKFENVTSKAAIEAKIKEVAVREGKAKDSPWKVLPSAWVAAGLPPPINLVNPMPTSQPIMPIIPPAQQPMLVDSSSF